MIIAFPDCSIVNCVPLVKFCLMCGGIEIVAVYVVLWVILYLIVMVVFKIVIIYNVYYFLICILENIIFLIIFYKFKFAPLKVQRKF